MSILTRYIIKEIIKYILIVMAMVVGIYLAVDFFEKIDNFLRADLPLTRAIEYFIYKLPFICAQIFPVAVLLSVVILLGLMAKNNELLALRSCGLSLYSMTGPIIALGLFFSLMLFLFAETVVPITSEKANEIWLRDVRKEPAVISREQNIWFKEKRQIIHIKYYDDNKETLYNVTVHYFSDDFSLNKRIDAQQGVFQQEKWRLYQVMEQVFDPEINDFRSLYYDEQVVELGFTPLNLKTVVKKAEEMSIMELFAYIRRIEEDGYDATKSRTDFHAKIAFPFICLILCLLGLGITGRGRLGDGIAVNVALAIGIAFLYWILYSFCMSLGYGDMFHPALAAWTANFIFFCIGVYKIMNVES